METIIPDTAATITVAEGLRWMLLFLLGLMSNFLSAAFKSGGQSVGQTISLLFAWMNQAITNRIDAITPQQPKVEKQDAGRRDEVAQNP